jgi:hypothetical protein
MRKPKSGCYHRFPEKAESAAWATLAALCLDAGLVVLLLNVPLRVTVNSVGSHTETAPSHSVVYVIVGPAAKTVGAKRERQSPPEASAMPAARFHGVPKLVGEATSSTDLMGDTASRRPRRTISMSPSIVRRGLAGASREEMIEAIIRTGIEPYNDSVARERRIEQRAVDWTFTARGARYGMSPGALHLGKISVRLPVVFAEPLALSSERRRASRQMIEDTRSEASRRVREAMFDSAVASIRLRKEPGARR